MLPLYSLRKGAIPLSVLSRGVLFASNLLLAKRGNTAISAGSRCAVCCHYYSLRKGQYRYQYLLFHSIMLPFKSNCLQSLVILVDLAITMGKRKPERTAKEVHEDAERWKRYKEGEAEQKRSEANEEREKRSIAKANPWSYKEERAKKSHKEAVAKEKARPKRSGELRLKLAGCETDATCVAGLAESFNGFKLLDEVDVQKVVDLVMEQEATVVHGFAHAADGDFRFAGLRSAALVRASLFGGGSRSRGDPNTKLAKRIP